MIPVPLYKSRLRQRGFNQAAELAKALASKLGVTYIGDMCKKTINTASQVGLNALARQINLRGAFKVQPMSCKYVIVVDDLITTGSTVNAVATALKHHGVERVDVLCCARAILHSTP